MPRATPQVVNREGGVEALDGEELSNGASDYSGSSKATSSSQFAGELLPREIPTPAPTPDCVPDTPISLTVEKPHAIVAGGWDQIYNGGSGGYYYLSKEKSDAGDANPWVKRDREVDSTDPHVVTLVATVSGGDGDLAGRTVTFHCDMSGPDPAQDVTATTDDQGVAKAAIISGDELSRDTDEETGAQLFDEPVTIDAKCGDASDDTSVDVLAPTIEWQIKNPDGDYVSWNGETWDNYYKFEESHDAPLRALLTFNGAPVFGHRVSWGFDKILDKAEVEVAPSDPQYSTYGHMSGAISTTAADGGATATYTLGYSIGQIIYAIEDASVHKPSATLPRPSTGLGNIGSSPTSALSPMTPGEASAPQPTGEKRKFRKRYKGAYSGVYKFVHDTPYNDVDGRPNSYHKEAYPAPSGEEDLELFQATRNKVISILPGTESKTGWRLQNYSGSFGERAVFQHGEWWFSQIVGDDPESFGTHLADVKVPVPNKSTFRRYSGAFDIVLTGVPIFLQASDPRNNGRRAEFGPYVKAMRDNGFVAWHRWAGEAASTSENEMHCIDPATPFLKQSLGTLQRNDDIGGQIGEFIKGKTGGASYPDEPVSGPFAITQDQIDRVTNAFHNKFSVSNAQPDNN